VRWLYAQEEIPGMELDRLAGLAVKQFPFLAERWSIPRHRRRAVAAILARRQQVAPLLGDAP
jgi:hypothetical protein